MNTSCEEKTNRCTENKESKAKSMILEGKDKDIKMTQSIMRVR